MTCKVCGVSEIRFADVAGRSNTSDDGVCHECRRQILAARSAREQMEARIADLEDKLTFVMNFFRPAFPSSIVGAPPTVMSLEQFYEKRKLESEGQASNLAITDRN